jgi:hypothetical protein
MPRAAGQRGNARRSASTTSSIATACSRVNTVCMMPNQTP